MEKTMSYSIPVGALCPLGILEKGKVERARLLAMSSEAFCFSVSVYKQNAVYSAVCMLLIHLILLQQYKAGELVAVQEGRATTVRGG